MKTVLLSSESIPALGLGTWRMGEAMRSRPAELAAVREAVRLGYRLFDTAEMYGEGGAETVLGEGLRAALAAGELTRDELFIVSKVYPHNAAHDAVLAACERSLQRLGLGRIDLYLLHWRGEHPLAGTVAAFEALKQAGRIRHWGVSNFDVADMQALWAVEGGSRCAANQVWYSASERGIEYTLLPWLQQHGVVTMAYSPIDQAALAADDTLAQIGQAMGATAAQVALAWLLRQPGVVAIPKAVKPAHLKDNLAAADLSLDAKALQAIDAAFAPPRHPAPLAMN
ncbi:MAG TPA: aldo/keto reductase [Ideonella sp.]|nr:aldo/keto reductase [Ideonella sp.]